MCICSHLLMSNKCWNNHLLNNYMLWVSVHDFDVILGERFKLRSISIFNIHDFPTYGLFICCVTIREDGLPLWFICIILLFKEMVCGRNCCYLPKSHIINTTKCIHWGNKNKGSIYMGIYIKYYQMGLGTKVVVRRFKKPTQWKTRPCTKKTIKQLSNIFKLPY